ncbi:MAG TPA: electron transfer flavoprotein subunit beta/FixA family protein [Spirochaetia bacterium]|nr:electron transfer flavoprotein subunit beta/FixA family protein [Spirochaetia bacterium]
MNIVTCIKQVPDTSEVKIDRETNTLIREGVPSIINPFDLNAIEEGLLLRERFGGSVTVISMGPPQVETALREALSLGVDRAVLLCDRAFAGSDTLATSYTLAVGIKKIDFDLILCGKQAIDGDTAQVGPEIAEWLDIPHLTYVSHLNEVSPAAITVSRLLEGGYEQASASLPALLTVVKELNEPRLPSYRASLRAKIQPVTVWGAADLDLDAGRIGIQGSPTKVTRSFVPELERQGQFLAGSPEEQAKALIAALQSARIIHGCS